MSFFVPGAFSDCLSTPDPDQWVGWGDRTVDEMGHAWLTITYYNDEDFKAELEKRPKPAATTTAGSQP